MRLLIIGHQNRIERIKSIMMSDYGTISWESLEYSNLKQSNEIAYIIKKRQSQFDGILFTGMVPFKIINSSIIPSIPCDYIHRDRSTLLHVLLKIFTSSVYNPFSISIDSFAKDEVEEIYSELSVSPALIANEYAGKIDIKADFINDLFHFHKGRYLSGRVTCCVTALNNVYDRLAEAGIPVFLLDQSTDLIKQSIERLQLKHEAHVNDKTKIVAISIGITYPSEHSVINQNEYQLFLDRNKVSEEIYMFGQRLQAAVIQEDNNHFLLFCTKSVLENETDNYNSIAILRGMNKQIASNVSVGIGHGITAREAKYSAYLGREKATINGHNTAYVVYNGDTIIGPITESHRIKEEAEIVDKAFYMVSEKSGIGINTLFKLHGMIDMYKKDTFTSHEMAHELGVSLRSMNKILTKLEDHHFVEIVGKKVGQNAGRPSRLIKILF